MSHIVIHFLSKWIDSWHYINQSHPCVLVSEGLEGLEGPSTAVLPFIALILSASDP